MRSTIITLLIILSVKYCQGQSNIMSDTIYLNLNDKLLIEAYLDSSNHISFKKVDVAMNVEKTMSIELKYGSDMGAMMVLKNPFPKKLHYKAELYSYKKKDYVETSVIPVHPNLVSYETWPYKIDKIRLTGFTLDAK